MHDFAYKNNELYCEKTKVSSIAKSVGTPFYLYSYKTLTDHFHKLQKAFKEIDPLICFAMKANDNSSVIKALSDQGAGFDIVSVGELQKALKVKADPQKIVFASVGKTEEEITLAIKANILFFNVESLPELEEINRIAKKMKKMPQVALRINPDVDAATHSKITTGTLKNKFGIDLKTALKILSQKNKYKNLKINGLHCHIGSQITTIEPYIKALTKVTNFIELCRSKGIEITTLNMGGGFGINYNNDKARTAQQFANKVLGLLKKCQVKVIIEPGRFIAGNAGIFVTQALYLKDNGVKKFLIVDGGMNDLIRPSLYNAYHEICPLKKTNAKKAVMDVVGPICESGDFFAKDRKLPMMKKGDLLAVMSAGAYGFVMASNYNVRRRPCEVMVQGNQYAIIKKRETFKDLIAGETIPAFLK